MTQPPTRRVTPGQYSYVPDEDEPTKPDGMADIAMSTIISISRQHCADDRKRLAKLLSNWQNGTAEQRALIEAVASELVR